MEMALFRRKSIPGSMVLPEPRLETAAIEFAIVRRNFGLATDGDMVAMDAFLSAAYDRTDKVAKSSIEREMVHQRADYLRERMEDSLYEYKMLYARFDMEKVEDVYNTIGYGHESFKVVFRAVPIWRLFGCMLFSGDERYTENGKIIYAIGFGASTLQLELIQQSLSKSLEFAKVCAKQPLKLTNESPFRCSEPLVNEGTMHFDSVKKPKDGIITAVSAFDELKRKGEI